MLRQAVEAQVHALKERQREVNSRWKFEEERLKKFSEVQTHSSGPFFNGWKTRFVLHRLFAEGKHFDTSLKL